MKRFLPLAAVVALAGCGALFNSGPQKVSFTSEPNGAEVWIDGARRGETPLILDLPKNQDYTVVMRKPGYGDATVALTKKVHGGYVVLDILGGILPVVVDAATGSWYVLSDDDVHLTLTSDEAQARAGGTLTGEQLRAVLDGEPVGSFVSLADAVAAR